MGFATHLGPWLLGTVKNTTGTTAGTIRNMGATVVTQANTLSYTDTSAKQLFVLPAGAQIINFYVDTTVAFNSGTNNVITISDPSANSLATVTATSANIVVGRGTVAVTGAQIAEYVNVGSTDFIVSGTFAGTGTAATTGTATVTVEYIVRNSNGAANPTSSQN